MTTESSPTTAPGLTASEVGLTKLATSLQGVPVSGSVYLGMGFAARTNARKNSAVKPDVIESVNERIAPEFVFEYVENYSELATLLDVSVSASYGASGISGGSASLKVMRATQMIKSNAYVALKMRVISKESTIKDAYLDDEALEFLKTKNAVGFYEKWGSHFIRTLYHGGELACIMQFSSAVGRSSDEFRAEIKAAVGAANGESSYVSKVMSLTSGRSVQIKYAQSGGSANPDLKDATTGVFVLTPDALIKRVSSFPGEVVGSTDQKGSSVPLFADIPSLKETLDWDPDNGIDLDNPLPEAIERIASSITILKEKLVEVLAIEASKAVLAPSVRAAAAGLKPYLQSQVIDCSRKLSEMMSNGNIKAELFIESFLQSRVRGLLGLPSSASRENAGDEVDMSEPDSATLKRRLFGTEPDLTIRPWPNVAYVGRWGFQGEFDNYGVPFNLQPRVPCPVHGGNVQVTARQLSGKTTEDDGIFAFATVHPVPIADGGNCGHHLVHFADFRIIEADRDLLQPLPSLPANPVSDLQPAPGSPRRLANNRWILPFVVDMPSPTSCGSYTIILTEALEGDPDQTNERQVSSYWLTASGQKVAVSHSVSLEDGWAVKSFGIQIGTAYYAA